MTTVNEQMKMQVLITVAKEVGVTFVVGMTKKQLVRDIQAKLAPATEETAVSQASENKPKERVAMNTPREQQLARNMKMIEKMDVKGNHFFDTKPEKYQNAKRISLVNEIKQKALGLMSRLGELPIHVVGFQWFLDAHNRLVPQGKKQNRYGILEIVVSPGVLQYHVWNAGTRKFEWHDFAGYTLDASTTGIVNGFHPVPAPAGYNGVMKLPIYHSVAMGGFFVMLPNAPMKGDGFRPMFKVADHRWETGGSTASIGRVNAALTAFLRMTQSQFIQANPLNRHGFNESCSTCAHSQWLATKDGLMDDEHMEDPKTNVVLNSLSTDESRDGSLIPQMWCTARGMLVDEQVVEVLNEAMASERQSVEYVEEIVMDNGEIMPRIAFRYPSKGEMVVDGEIRKVAGARAEGTKSICEGCPFYSKNERKSDTRVNSEVVAERERIGNNQAVVGKDIFISKYYTDMVRADRQVVQTLNAKGEWTTAFPVDVPGATDIRIKGIGGIMVYGGHAIKEALAPLGVLNYGAPVEAFDAERASVENMIQVLFSAARNFSTLTQEKANDIFALAMAKPASLDKGQSVRWDRAVEWLRQSVIWAQESAAFRNRPDFTTKFVTEVEEAEMFDIQKLHTDDFISNLQESDRQGFIGYGLGYRDLDYKDMVKYLEETISLQVVDHILETGEKFWVVDGPVSESVELMEGEKSDADLVAGALQYMLNAQINSLLYGVRRDADPVAAIQKLRVCDEVKDYIKAVIKL